MKKELIKSSLIVVLFFLIGSVQAQQNDFGKRKHKSRTSIYKVKATAPSGQKEVSKEQSIAVHERKASKVKMHQYRWSNTPPRNPNPSAQMEKSSTPLKKADLVNPKVNAVKKHRTTRSECQPFRKKRHKRRSSNYKY